MFFYVDRRVCLPGIIFMMVLHSGLCPVTCFPSEELHRMEVDILKKRLDIAEEKLRESQVARLVYETQVQVAAIHKFEVIEPVTYKPLDLDVLLKVFNESVDRQYPGRMLELVLWSYQLFDMVPDDYDLIHEMQALLSEQVGGLYDPGSGILYVHTDFALESSLGTIILAHEICHAMQDQNFNLMKLGLEQTGNDDAAVALHAVVEGDATLLMSEHMVEYGNPLAVLFDLPKILSINQQKFNEAPAVMQEMFLFPYLSGSSFLTALAGRSRQHPDSNLLSRGPAWRNLVFESPPESTEMILHPEKYLEREMPAEIPPFDVTEEGIHAANVIGEMGMILMLQPTLGRVKSELAAAGWNGDRILFGENEEGTGRTFKWVTKWDSAGDADEFVDSMIVVFKTLFPDGEWIGRKGAKIRRFKGCQEKVEILRSDDSTVQMEGKFNILSVKE
jgi:hypothetical protein